MTVRVRRLEEADDRSLFRSGNADLDRFFIRYAGQNQFRHHVGTTYVAVGTDDRILGFATVAAAEISPAALPSSKRRKLPNYSLPALRLARLAVDQRAQGSGAGRILFQSILSLTRQLADSVGCIGVIVDAKPEAVGFYKSLNFVLLEMSSGQLGDRPEPVPMFFELPRRSKKTP